MTQRHASEAFGLALGNGRIGARRAVPVATAERPVSDQ
jgi:hypothetical protein